MWHDLDGLPCTDFLRIFGDYCVRVRLKHRAGIRVRRIAHEKNLRWVTASQVGTEAFFEDHRDIGFALPEKAFDRIDSLECADDIKPPVAGEARAKRSRGIVRCRVNERDSHTVHFVAQREAKQDDHRERQKEQDEQRLAIAEYVARLLDHEPGKRAVPP
jgi:hypothetical protein